MRVVKHEDLSVRQVAHRRVRVEFIRYRRLAHPCAAATSVVEIVPDDFDDTGALLNSTRPQRCFASRFVCNLQEAGTASRRKALAAQRT